MTSEAHGRGVLPIANIDFIRALLVADSGSEKTADISNEHPRVGCVTSELRCLEFKICDFKRLGHTETTLGIYVYLIPQAFFLGPEILLSRILIPASHAKK